jgi:hypothetical protein
MRPAMGYAAGSNAFGYVAHIGYAGGARGFGAISSTMMSTAADAGISPAILSTLSAAGATDTDIQNLMNGTTDLDTLYAEYGIAGSPSQVAAAVAATPVTATPAASSGPGQLPTGSVIQYQGGWTEVLADPTSAIQQALSTGLQQYGMQLTNFVNTGSTLLGTGKGGFTATIAITGLGFNLVTDAQSIIVTIVQSVIGVGNLTTNQIGVVSLPAGASATVTPAAAAPDFTTWLENNALWIGGGVAALVILNAFLGKKR